MKKQDCTHTRWPHERSVLVQPLAVVWYAQGRLSDCAGRIAQTGLTWLERARQRRALSELNDHMLRDIGLTRADAWAESEKPFWRA
jgi:uncharacterized protein YjiS (DUF1127 family)